MAAILPTDVTVLHVLLLGAFISFCGAGSVIYYLYVAHVRMGVKLPACSEMNVAVLVWLICTGVNT